MQSNNRYALFEEFIMHIRNVTFEISQGRRPPAFDSDEMKEVRQDLVDLQNRFTAAGLNIKLIEEFISAYKEYTSQDSKEAPDRAKLERIERVVSDVMLNGNYPEVKQPNVKKTPTKVSSLGLYGEKTIKKDGTKDPKNTDVQKRKPW